MKNFFFAVFFIALGVNACAKPEWEPLLIDKGLSTPMQRHERLVALDEFSASIVFYVSHQQVRLPSGQVSVTINLHNKDPKRNVMLDWKVVFYDNNNFQIEETEWNKTFFPARQIKAIKANSIRKDVQNFTVMLRSPIGG